MDIKELKTASNLVKLSSEKAKNAFLETLANLLEAHKQKILKANKLDLDGLTSQQSGAFRERLTLSEKRIQGMCDSLRMVEALPDPVNRVLETHTLENELVTEKRSIPIGVILFVFESRPNVLVESFSIALKSGNVMLAKPGSESKYTSQQLSDLIHQALIAVGLPPNSLTIVPDRENFDELLGKSDTIDLVIPRGGSKLIDHVVSNTKIPVLKNDCGQCHIYVDESADLEVASRLIENSKVDRPSVCNSLETVLVHQSVSEDLLSALRPRLMAHEVQVRTCERSASLLKNYPATRMAEEKDWSEEHLDLILNFKIVDDIDEAILHIQHYGSKHSDCIVTQNDASFQRFSNSLDSAVIYRNASTRFTDGAMFGMGGEIGVSTQMIHARGPVGLKELTTYKWIVTGSGQIRNSN